MKNNKVQLLQAGLIRQPDLSKNTLDSLRNSFGYKVVNIGINSKGIQRYNEVVENYLEGRNGTQWRMVFERKIDSLQKLK